MKSITLLGQNGPQLGDIDGEGQKQGGNELLQNIWSWSAPQFVSLILTVIILIVISLVVFFKVKKVKPYEAPKGVALIAEMYVGALDNNYNSTAGEEFPRGRYYIFALLTFLTVGNLTPIFGLDPIATSYSIPFSFTLATWIGMFVFGFMYKKWKYLKEIIFPWKLMEKIPPLISLSFRMYGNITGGGTVVLLLYLVFGHLWTLAFGNSSEWFFFGNLVTPFVHFYFDVFDTLVQGYVFITLTTIYWLNESGVDEQEEEHEEGKITAFTKKMNKKLKEKIRLSRHAKAVY